MQKRVSTLPNARAEGTGKFPLIKGVPYLKAEQKEHARRAGKGFAQRQGKRVADIRQGVFPESKRESGKARKGKTLPQYKKVKGRYNKMKFNYEEMQTLEKFASLKWANDYEIGDLFIKKDEKEIMKIEEGISINTLMSLWAIIYYEKNKRKVQNTL